MTNEGRARERAASGRKQPDPPDGLEPEAETALETHAQRTGAKLAIALGVIVVIAFAWQLTGLDERIEPETIAAFLERAPGGAMGALVTIAAFVVGGFVVFPVTALIFAAAIAYGPWFGLAYAMVGSYLSAFATFGAGRMLGKRVLARWPSAAITTVNKQLARRGVLAIAVLRFVPIAPFTLVNALAGASAISVRDYLIGTVLGMTPNVAMLIALGGQLGAVLRDPSVMHILTFGVLGALWIALALGMQRFVDRIERRRRAQESI